MLKKVTLCFILAVSAVMPLSAGQRTHTQLSQTASSMDIPAFPVFSVGPHTAPQRASRGVGPRTNPVPTTTTTATAKEKITSPTGATRTAMNRLRDAVRPQTPASSARPALNRFLLCVRHRESRDNYTVVNRRSGAGGAFQFLPSTWRNVLRHAGVTGPSRAELASPALQDAMAVNLYNWQGRAPWAGPGC